MTINSNNETIKQLLIQNCIERMYMTPQEYGLFVSLIGEPETLTLQFYCDHCHELHNDDFAGLKIIDSLYILCQHPMVLENVPYYLLGWTVPVEIGSTIVKKDALLEHWNEKVIPNVKQEHYIERVSEIDLKEFTGLASELYAESDNIYNNVRYIN